MVKKFSKYLILLVLFICNAYSQEMVPPIQNFSPAEYSAASQNWDIAVDDRGIVYTANNQGLLVFDGINWDLYTLDSHSIIRSVYPHEDKIFTGSYEEFGYWETTDEGSMQYTSLTPLMEQFDLQSDEFWEILSFDKAIYFRSFGGVFRYENNSISRVKDIVSTALGVYKGKLLHAPRKNGLAFLDKDGETAPLEGDLSALDDLNIIDLETYGDTLYIAGKESLFMYSDGRLTRFNNSRLNDLFKRSELNHILAVSANEIILGTIKDGIIQYDLRNGNFQVFNRNSGLQNNTVLGMAYSREKLWLALDKGVDMVDLQSPVRFYTDISGELGAVYDLQNYKDNFYLASNTGTYVFSGGDLNLIENAGDHTWNLQEIDKILYANHNTGVYKIARDQFIPLDSRTGSFTISEIPGKQDSLLIGSYTGISLLDRKKGTISELPEINFPVKEVVFENKNTIWAAHPYEGIYKITHENFQDLNLKKVRSLGKKENFNPKIYKINNQFSAYVNNKWYKYNPFKEDFESFQELKEYMGYRLIYQDDIYYVFVNDKDGDLIITDLKGEKFLLGSKDLNYRLVKSNENFVKENDSVFYVTLNDGFARVNLNELKRKNKDQWLGEPYIKDFRDDTQSYSLEGSPQIPFSDSRNISIKIGMPFSHASGLKYTLSGEEELSGIVNSGILNFRNLDHGDYQLQLSAVGTGLSESNSKSFKFSIAPPWYLSWPIKSLYVDLFIGILYLIYWLNRQKLKKHQLQLEEKFEKEHAERLNRIEKERLMHEIDLKRKELANTTMMAAKKNEVLMEIQGELNKDKAKFSNQFRLKHIMTKINHAVKNKDEWQVFETNFNEVHEDFFKDILEKYPKLTGKDLKLCSYLKMNLSSKEIAPLMGISVRGVEVHRYRLRKKMDLDSDVNLTKFLIKNF